jgi:PAS domain S-box-containing protein
MVRLHQTEAAMAQLFPGEEEMLEVLEVLALSDDPMFVIDDRHRIVFWNRHLQRLLGYAHDEVAGRSCASVLAGSDAFGNRYCSEACPVQWIARRGEIVRQFRLHLRAKEGPPVSAEINVIKFTLRVSKRTLLAHVVVPVAEAMASEPAATNVRATTLSHHADARVRELTEREIEILSMLAAGQHTGTIAGRLGISPLTTRNHIQHVFAKLEVHSQSEAVAFAYRMRLVPPA